MKNPFDILHLPHDATVTEIKARWKVLAQQYHPDKSGCSDTFFIFKNAKDAAIAIASKPKKCEFCENGKLRVVRGFQSTAMRCNRCNGTGFIKPEGS